MNRPTLSSIRLLLLAVIALAPIASADVDAAMPESVIRLIAEYGSGFTETLESLKELQPGIEKGLSPEKALSQYLAKASPAKQTQWINRLSEILSTRQMLERESAKAPNGLYEVLSAIPPLATTAHRALEEAGITSKDAYEVASNMSSAQSAHLLTRVAVRIVDSSPAEKEKLISAVKGNAQPKGR